MAAGHLSAQTISEAADAALDATAALRPYRWGILMENATGSAEYYARNPETGMIPASNTKLFTTAAAVGLLGENYAFRTRVYRTAGAISGGVFTGNIIILGEHDPTWHSDTLGSGNSAAAIRRMAQQVRTALAAQGITQITGRVEGYGAMMLNKTSTNTDHESLSSTTVSNLNREAAAGLRTELITAGVPFTSVISSVGFTGFTPDPSWVLLHTHLSTSVNDAFVNQPLRLVVVCDGINKPSHNPGADILMRHIGYALAGEDSYEAGAEKAIEWFTETAGLSGSMVLNDGSGLSGGNRVSARQTVDLLRYMVPASPRWAQSLPISCTDGTLGSRLCGTLTGDVHAKTGTLPSTGAISLSGYLDHPLDRQRYYFSIYVNTLSGAINTTDGRAAIDNVVRALGDRLPPFSPDLLVARATAPNEVELQWTDALLTGDSYRISATPSGPWSEAAVGAAYVIEPGRSDNALGLNRNDASFTGSFANSSSHSTASGLTAGIGSRFISRATGVGVATFAPSQLPAGRYRVDVTCFDFSSAHATNIEVAFIDRMGTRTLRMALSEQTAGNRWRALGTIDFLPGQNHRIEFRNSMQTTTSGDDRMNPAAVRFIPLFTRQPAETNILREYRVGMVGPRSVTPPSSDQYAVRPGAAPSVLVVDGYDRWASQGQSGSALTHAFAAVHARSISGRAIDSVANEALTAGLVALPSYPAVVWGLGEETTTDETFSAAEQTLVSSYLQGGGALLASGSEIAWDLDRISGPTASDRAFIKDRLGAGYDDARTDALNDDAATATVTGSPAGPFAAFPAITFDQGQGGGLYAADFPDVLQPVGAGATVAFSYSGGTSSGLGAAVTRVGTGRTILLGFPFETIISAPQRDQLMSAAMDFLDPAEPNDATLWMIH
jgi:D-alanyl-D-alanine carboxypeptidase